MGKEEPKLCYVRGSVAYFTTQPVSKQWGDDWDDAPYEYNAGRPYEYREGSTGDPYEIISVTFYGPFHQPCDGDWSNSPYSVDRINKEGVPWLRVYPKGWDGEYCDPYGTGTPKSSTPVALPGMTIPEFVRAVKQHGGLATPPRVMACCTHGQRRSTGLNRSDIMPQHAFHFQLTNAQRLLAEWRRAAVRVVLLSPFIWGSYNDYDHPTMHTIPALTILQPWASAIACGAKCIETRSWETSYRGPVALTAAKRHAGKRDAAEHERLARIAGLSYWDLPYGAIIAVAELIDCGVTSAGTGVVPALVGGQLCTYGVSPRELALGDYTTGRYGWVLRDVTPITPIPWRGKQGLWKLPTSALEANHD